MLSIIIPVCVISALYLTIVIGIREVVIDEIERYKEEE
jgi:hypothetical protein